MSAPATAADGTLVNVGDRFRAKPGMPIWRVVRMLDGSERKWSHVYLSREEGERSIVLLSARMLAPANRTRWVRVSAA